MSTSLWLVITIYEVQLKNKIHKRCTHHYYISAKYRFHYLNTFTADENIKKMS